MGVLSPPEKWPQLFLTSSQPTHSTLHQRRQAQAPEIPRSKYGRPRLLVNRACVYERHLPGGAYITAHVSRLQHGFWDSPALSDTYAEHVDFLALSFVFHSAHTLSHRFKSATVRASVQSISEKSKPAPTNGVGSRNPHFLMHAPHLIYGTVSPETMEWSFSLAGSLGVSETPVSASLIPSGSVNGQYRRYEMMRIQGSSRTLRSPKGPAFDVEAGEILWSLEENNLQRSGLPREFTFVMLIQKPAANSKIKLSLEIDPVIQAWVGSYPSWMLRLPPYQPVEHRGVNFRREIGQRFLPADPERGFNFAAMESAFDHYIAMPAESTRVEYMEIPPETQLPQFSNGQQGYPGQYGNLNLSQQQGTNLTNILLQNQLRQLSSNSGAHESVASAPAPASATTALVGPMAVPISIPGTQSSTNTYNVHLGFDPTLAQQLTSLHASPPALQSRVYGAPMPHGMNGAHDVGPERSSSGHVRANSSATEVGWWLYDHGTYGNPEWSSPFPNAGVGRESYENLRAGMLRTVHPWGRDESSGSRRNGRRVMSLRNQPLTSGLLSSLSEDED